MEPVKTPGETRPIGAPNNWNPETDGQCGVLSVRDEKGQGGLPVMISTWQPTEEEIARIAAGAPVHLGVYGTVHPVVCMYAGEATMSVT